MSGLRIYTPGSIFDALTSDFPSDMQDRVFTPYQGVVGGAMVQAHARQMKAAVDAIAERRAKGRKRKAAGAALSRGPVVGATSISRPVAR